MLENFVTDKFEYKKLSEAEQKARRILGRLTGVIAETKKPTRNGRGYSIELWENVFENPIMKEKIANRCCFGELNHPADRTEIDIEKVAICLAEQPKKSKDGRLYGVFDILDTPNGRILKTLCDYGCKIGISSRGQGDIITDHNGDDVVDPDTYECECFDAVLIPGVEAARLTYVTESLDTKKSLKQTLTESLDAASEDDKVIMKETLENLNLILEDTKEEEIVDEIVDDEVDVEDEIETATDDEVVDDIDLEDDLVDDDAEDAESEEETEEEIPTATPDDLELELQDVEDAEKEPTDEEIFLDFLANNFDEDKVKEVCKILDIEIEDEDKESEETEVADTEEVDGADVTDDEINTDSTEEVEEISDENIDSDEEEEEQDEEPVEEAIDDGASALVSTLKETLKAKSDLENDVKSLQEKLAVSDAKVDTLTEECNRYKLSISRLSQLAKSSKDLSAKVSALEESLTEKDEMINSQKLRISRLIESRKQSATAANEVTTLTESLNSAKTSYEAQINALNESIEKQKQESQTQLTELTESLKKTTAIKESYRNLANKAVNKYIEVKADILGLTTKDIKRKLGESYTLEDVDQVCEDLKSYQLNVSRLPFSIDRKVSVKVNESAATRRMKPANAEFEDDGVDAGLIRLANLD